MKQLEFERLYGHCWVEFATALDALEKGDTSDASADFALNYRRLCQYRALCNSRQYSSYLIDQLDALITRGHAVLYRRKTHFAQAVLSFLVTGFPRQLRTDARLFWWVCGCFYVPALAIALALYWQPELIFTLMSPPQVQELEAMFNPANQTVGEARESPTNWLMFGHYIQNNIGLACRTFAAGLVAGVGALALVFYNGLMVGASSAHLTAVGSSETFFTFVIGHGSFELTAIIIAGTAGLKLGLSLLQPGNLPRLVALRQASGGALLLIMGAMVMLLVAAFVEAFWSSNNLLAPWQKYFIGGLLWLLVIVYLTLSGRPARSPRGLK